MDDCPACPLPSASWWHPFSTASFVTRDHCGSYPAGGITAWVLMSLLIGVLYLVIAAANLWVWRRTRSESGYPRRWHLWIAAFFVGCAGAHLRNAMAFWWPAYVAFIWWDAATLIVSAGGAVGVIRLARWSLARVGLAEGAKRDAEARAKAAEDRLRQAELVREIATQRLAVHLATDTGV